MMRDLGDYDAITGRIFHDASAESSGQAQQKLSASKWGDGPAAPAVGRKLAELGRERSACAAALDDCRAKVPADLRRDIRRDMRVRTCVSLAHPLQVHALGRMASPAAPDDSNVRDAISAYAACEKVRSARS